jgi:hypothetical protein
MEAVTTNERHKKCGRKDGNKITGDGNRLFGFDQFVPGCALGSNATATLTVP